MTTDQSQTTALTVEYFHEIPGVGAANIMWKPSHPMKFGRFPRTHPAAPGDGFEFGMGRSEQMQAFRSRGYWAICFPEGDGIIVQCKNGQDAATVAADIEAAFGWRVKVRRA